MPGSSIHWKRWRRSSVRIGSTPSSRYSPARGRRVRAHHLLREPQHEEQGLLRDRDASPLGQEGDRDAAGTRRLEIDAVAPGRTELDEPERRAGGVHELARHRHPPAHDGGGTGEHRVRRRVRGVRRNEVDAGSELPDERKVVRTGRIKENRLHGPGFASSSCTRSQALT